MKNKISQSLLSGVTATTAMTLILFAAGYIFLFSKWFARIPGRLALIIALFAFQPAQAQDKLITRTGQATIFSHTDAEDISATNNNVSGVINTGTGEIGISVPVQSFEFEKALMQQHFNSDHFMDSKDFPRITLKGKIDNLSAVNFTTEGQYPVQITGQLTIRDQTKPLSQQATVTVEKGKVTVTAKFMVRDIGSYGVGKPKGSKKNNVADDIQVTYTAVYTKGDLQ